MGKRQRTTKKRKNYLRIGKNPDRCPNCGEYGPHFVPPSFGDKGFFICPSAISKDADREMIGDDAEFSS